MKRICVPRHWELQTYHSHLLDCKVLQCIVYINGHFKNKILFIKRKTSNNFDIFRLCKHIKQVSEKTCFGLSTRSFRATLNFAHFALQG